MKIKIKVTQSHIDNGIRNNCSKCPVALAMRDSLIDDIIRFTINVSKTIFVFGFYEYGNGEYQWASNILPAHVVFKIGKFDSLGVMKPFEFETEVGTLSPHFIKGGFLCS